MGEANAREVLEESGNGELGLEPQAAPQAEVRATPERAMVHTLTRDVETVGFGMLLGIAIGEQPRATRKFSWSLPHSAPSASSG
jgi:hypothetical protein